MPFAPNSLAQAALLAALASKTGGPQPSAINHELPQHVAHQTPFARSGPTRSASKHPMPEGVQKRVATRRALKGKADGESDD